MSPRSRCFILCLRCNILPCDIRQFLFNGLPLHSVIISYNIHYNTHSLFSPSFQLNRTILTPTAV